LVRAILRHKQFALLWSAGVVSVSGDWFLLIALPLHVYRLTGSPTASGAVFAADALPRVLLGSVAGVFVDRWDRRRTLIVADLLQAVVLLPLLLVQRPDDVWLVYPIVIARTAVAQFFGPAEGALVPHLVPVDDLPAANALTGVGLNLARLVGPPLGAFLVVLGGFRAAVLGDAVSFLVSAGLIGLMKVHISSRLAKRAPHPSGEPRVTSVWIAVWHEWRAGLRVVREQQVLVAVFLLTVASGVAEGMLAALMVPWVTERLRGGATELGWIASCQAAGSVVGGVLVGRLGRAVPPGLAAGIGMIGLGLIDVLIFTANDLPAVLSLMAIVGLPVAALITGVVTLLQASTTDDVRGRVLGARTAMFALFQFAGISAASAIAAADRLVPLLVTAALLDVLGGVVLLLVLRRAALASASRLAAAAYVRTPA
jgi:MFS family permease